MIVRNFDAVVRIYNQGANSPFCPKEYIYIETTPLPTKYPAFHDSQNLVNKSKSSMKIRIPSTVFLEKGPKDPSHIKKNSPFPTTPSSSVQLNYPHKSLD
jgi:hypothetical protein